MFLYKELEGYFNHLGQVDPRRRDNCHRIRMDILWFPWDRYGSLSTGEYHLSVNEK